MLEKSRIYKLLQKIIDDYTSVYNYNFLLEKDDIVRKSYMTVKGNFVLSNLGKDNPLMASECLSLAINILKEAGLNPNLVIGPTDDDNYYNKLYDYLNYLDIDYEIITSGNKGSFKILEDNTEIGSGDINDKISVTLFTDEIIDILRDMNLRVPSVDVNILADSDEALMKANILLQDLRLSGVIADISVAEAKITLSLKDELLNKGLINVLDNITKEGQNIPEDEIIDYILGMI